MRRTRSGAGRRPRRLAASLVLVLCLLVLGPHARARTLTVAAASSLTDVFATLVQAFHDAWASSHDGGRGSGSSDDVAAPGPEIRLAFGASSTLATQILQGAPFDVFASADTRQLDRVVAGGFVASEPRVFAENRLVLAVPEGGAVATLEDVGAPGTWLVLAAPQVPAGAYADEALRRASDVFGDAWRRAVEANVVSREPNVRQVAAKVALGEADAAIVYATDVRGLAGVRAVELPDGVSPRARYPVAPLAEAADPGLAAAFVDFLFTPDARTILETAGFSLPAD